MAIDYKELQKQVQSDFDNELNVTDDLKGLSLEEIQAIQKSRTVPFAVCAFNILGNINISTMVRTAVIVAAEKFFIVGRKKWDRRGTVGAQNYIDLEVHSTMSDELEVDSRAIYDIIVNAGYRPIAVDTCEPDKIWKYHFQNKFYNPTLTGFKPCFVFGNEGLGLPQDFLDLCEEDKITIPQFGVMRSLNVSTAAGIVMWHVSNNMRDDNGCFLN